MIYQVSGNLRFFLHSPEVPHQSVEHNGFVREGIEYKVHVEAAGRIIFGMNEQGANTGDIRSLKRAPHGISDESRPQPFALPTAINRKAGKKVNVHHRDTGDAEESES